MKKNSIALFEPYIDSKEIYNVNQCLKANWISSKGKFIDIFEKKFTSFVKTKYSLTIVNGTAALHLALLALEVGPLDEVIVPSYTYIAPVNAIKYVGAKPIFADVNFFTSQIDETKLDKIITKKTKAIIVPHLYGQIAQIDVIKNFCKKKRIFLIEDCAESFGCYFKNKHIGTFGDIGIFSFFGSKTITTGEGGMLITFNKKLANKVYKLKTVGVNLLKNNYWHDIIGYNYRMTNICAAIGVAQLDKANKILKMKKRVFKLYNNYLNKEHIRMNSVIKNSVSSYWQIVIYLKSKKIKNYLNKILKKNRIETRPTFPPVHLMPMYYKKLDKIKLKNTFALSSTGILLPSSPSLKENEIKKICLLINKALLNFAN